MNQVLTQGQERKKLVDQPVEKSIQALLDGIYVMIVEACGKLGEILLESIRDELLRLEQEGKIQLDTYVSALGRVHLCQEYVAEDWTCKPALILTLDASWKMNLKT